MRRTASTLRDVDVFAQPDSLVTFGWGGEDLTALGPTCQAVVIVDVLRFTSAVSVACNQGGVVLPFEWDHDAAATYAIENKASVAERERGRGRWTLSPTDLALLPAGTRLVLPSPNGSALSFRAASLGCGVVAGSLRNADAVARYLVPIVLDGERVAVIAAGERWRTGDGGHGPLRPAVEDLLGAGAVLSRLAARLTSDLAKEFSPEARAAAAAFVDAEPYLAARLASSASGRELRERGWDDDVATCSELDADEVVPVLTGNCYVHVAMDVA